MIGSSSVSPVVRIKSVSHVAEPNRLSADPVPRGAEFVISATSRHSAVTPSGRILPLLLAASRPPVKHDVAAGAARPKPMAFTQLNPEQPASSTIPVLIVAPVSLASVHCELFPVVSCTVYQRSA